MSGFCKVEMSTLPFRQIAEAEIGTFELLTMSGNELRRIGVLAEVLSGRRTEASLVSFAHLLKQHRQSHLLDNLWKLRV